MGKGKKVGTLHVTVHDNSIETGAKLKGVVHLLVQRSSTASELVLYFKGKEETSWVQKERVRRKKDDRDEDVVNTYTGRNTIAKSRFQVAVFPSQILRVGQYNFPFEIRIPANVPSSFQFAPAFDERTSPGPIKATISYQLTSKLEGHSPHISKFTIPIHLTQPLVSPGIPLHDEHTAHLFAWCCLCKGRVRIRADFSRSAFEPGDTADVTVEANNSESKLEGTAFKVTLDRMLRLKDGEGNCHTLSEKVSETQLNERMSAGGEQSACIRRRLAVMIPSDERVAKAGSVQSQLIECHYSLSCEMLMEGCWMCCSGTPSITKTIIIYPPQLGRTPIDNSNVRGTIESKPVLKFVAAPLAIG